MRTPGPSIVPGFAALFLVAIVQAGLGGCTKPAEVPRIDMTNDETAAQSIAKMRDSLSESDRQRVVDATIIIVRHSLGQDGKARAAAALDPEAAKAAVGKALNGKSAAEIIADAEAISGEPILPQPPAPPAAPTE